MSFRASPKDFHPFADHRLSEAECQPFKRNISEKSVIKRKRPWTSLAACLGLRTAGGPQTQASREGSPRALPLDNRFLRNIAFERLAFRLTEAVIGKRMKIFRRRPE